MQTYHISLQELTRLSGQAYSSVRRWRSRIRNGQSPVRKAGPKKIEPLDLQLFAQELGKLVHKRKRSYGSGSLHAAFDASLSRRDINQAVARARAAYNAIRREQLHHIEWLHPNLVWSLDDTQFAGRSRCIHTIRDLASRYQMQPLTGDMASGDEVATHLEELFLKHGAPLFIKRDNGGNLNHQAVNEVLAKWMVIPVNSPVCCPQYNGAIENAQKDWDRFLDPRDPFVVDNLHTCSCLAAHDLNHTPRPVLKNRIPCAVYHGPDKLKPSKRYRKDAYEWITHNALDLTGQDDKSPACAWRTAVLTWLLMNHHINITHPKCVTRFSNRNRS